uniref:SKP1-like protein 1A n=1 Tax=Erigeron canadensis TaxID=72917 RepID=UPI001CB9C7F2|nr:SKP1-like protein 1A [Erigeron canadensis]
MYLKMLDGPVMVDEILTMESELIGRFYEYEYHGELSLRIKNSILIKVIDFCKKCAEIRIQHSNSDDDEKVLQDKLKDFDADFIKPFQSDDAALFHLMDAACKLEINILMDMLMDYVADVMTRTNPEDLGKFFFIYYNGSDRLLNSMKNIIGITRWVLK